MKLRALLSVVLILPLCVSAQIRWTTRNPAPLTIPIKAIAAGNGLYVAVAEHGTVISSTDAQNWQIETFPSTENLNNISFANGLFFARGTSGTIFVSDNGHYWLQRLGGGTGSGGSPLGHDIVFGNGMYVGVSSYMRGAFVTSPDGVTWTVDPNRIGDQIAFGAGKFVMGSAYYNGLSISTDGLTWTQVSSPGTNVVSQLTFGAGLFVLRSGSQLYQSPDATTWALIPNVSVSDVVFVKDRFIALELGTRIPMTSVDGLTWLKFVNSPVRLPPGQIAGIGNSFVGFGGFALYRSDDATHWSTSGTNFTTTASLPGVAFAQGRFLTGDGNTSIDGVTWITGGASLPAAAAPNGMIQSANDRFILMSRGSVYTSTDGLAVTKSADLSFEAKSVTYGNGRYVIVGATADGKNGGAATSTDALVWTDRSSVVTLRPLIAIGFGRGLFVAVSADGSIYSSPDGAAWTNRPHPATTSGLSAIAFGAGRWVIAGMPSLTSTDGIVWSYAATLPDASAVAFANDTFLLSPYTSSANNNTIKQPAYGVATSSDGLNWTYRDTAGFIPNAYAFGAGTWVGVSYNGRISQSPASNASLAPAFTGEPIAAFGPGNTEDIVLDAPALGAVPVSYQWFKEGTLVPGATSSSITITNWKSEWLATGYSVVATNAYGSGMTQYRMSHQTRQLQSDDSGLVLSAELLPPDQINLRIGNALSFDPLMLGPGPRHYQWFKNGIAIPNSDAQSITVAHDAVADLDSIYSVTLTNLFGRVSFDFDLAPKVTSAPSSQEKSLGSIVTFTTQVRARSSGGDVVFTWKKDGQPVRTQTVKSYAIFNQSVTDNFSVNSVGASDYGLYQLTVTNNLGTVATKFFTLAPPPVSRLVNLSVRAPVGTGDDALIAGFVTAGATASPHLLIRGIGPTLGSLGVGSPLAQPHLMLSDANRLTVATNDQWDLQPGYDAGFIREMMAGIGAFPLPAGSRDTAIIRSASLASAPSPRFSAILSGQGNSTGVGLIELYEFAPTTGRLINLSARARVGTGENVLIAGFVVTGTQPVKLLIRAAGPTLGSKGVTGFLPNPKLTLNDRLGREFHNNDNWNQARNLADLRAATSATGAFAFDENSLDAAMLETLEPGVYSVQVSAADGVSGISLVEIYEAP